MSQSRNQKQQYWAEQIQRAEASGLSLIDYARLNILSTAHLYQCRYARRSATSLAGSGN